jgi:hypothetical protein
VSVHFFTFFISRITKRIFISDVVYEYVKLVRKLSDFVDSIWVKIVNADWKNITDMDSFATSSNVFYGSYCFTLKNDLANGILGLNFILKPISEVKSVALFFKDTLRLVHRAIPEHELAYIGGRRMEVLLNGGSSTLFNIEISQNINIEGNPNQKCRNYPHSGYTSYGECDQAYVLKKLTAIFGIEFVPLWAAKKISEVKGHRTFHRIGPLGRFGLVVTMSIYGYIYGRNQTGCEKTKNVGFMPFFFDFS